MEPCERNDLDQRIRESFEPDEEAVQRIVGRALAAGDRRPRRLLAALAAVGICAAVWLILVRTPAESPEVLTLDCFGEVVVVQAPDGTSWVFSGRGQDRGPGAETGLILCEEDTP